MRIRHAYTVVKHAILNNEPILLVGDPGLAKTSTIKQACAELKARHMISHTSVKDPTDFSGMPWFDPAKREAFFAPFGDLRIAMQWVGGLLIWFLDDAFLGKAAVQGPLTSLLLERAVDGKKISDKVRFVLATNRRGGTGVNQAIEQLKQRVIILEITLPLEDWIADYAIPMGVSTMTIGFLRFKPEYFTHNYEEQPVSADFVNYPSARSWTKADKIMGWGMPENLVQETIAGVVGKGPAGEYMTYARMHENLPNLDAIIMSPETAGIPAKQPDVLHAICTGLAVKATEANLGQIIKYAHRLKAEKLSQFATLLVRDCVRRDTSLLTAPALRQLCTSKTELAEIINQSY